ncbi:MAG: HEAT repeat domain-containing protein [Acidimicrobiia bacterium]
MKCRRGKLSIRIGRRGLSGLLAAVALIVGACDGTELGSKSTTQLMATARNASAGPGERCAATTELGKRKAKAAVGTLEALLTLYNEPRTDKDNLVVASCGADALGAIGDPQAVPSLLEAWSSTFGDAFYENQVIEALVSLGPPAEPALVAALGSTPWPASEALARIYRADVDHLLPLLQSQETVAIYHGIIGLGKRRTEPALKDALTRFGDKQMAEDYLNSGNAQLAAAANEWTSALCLSGGPCYIQGTPTFGLNGKQPWGSMR